MVVYVYSLLCFILPCVIWQLVNRKKLQGRQNVIRHIIWTYIFMFYCYLAVQDAAGMGTIWDFASYGKLNGPINMIPFQSDGVKTYILNIIMFMPLGFLLPLIWEDFRQIKKTVLAGVGLSLTIEISQLFCLRVTDIDDLMMNTLGAVFGYLIWLLFKKIFTGVGTKSMKICNMEPVIYLGLGIAGIFFLDNWRMFY